MDDTLKNVSKILRSLGRQDEASRILLLQKCEEAVLVSLSKLEVSNPPPKNKTIAPAKKKKKDDADITTCLIWYQTIKEQVRDLTSLTSDKSVVLSFNQSPAQIVIDETMKHSDVVLLGTKILSTCKNASMNNIRQHYLQGLFWGQLAEWHKASNKLDAKRKLSLSPCAVLALSPCAVLAPCLRCACSLSLRCACTVLALCLSSLLALCLHCA